MAKKSGHTSLNTKANFNVSWEELMEDDGFVPMFLSDVLEDYVVKQRWYGGKSSTLKYIELSEYFRIQRHEEVYYGLILEVNFKEAFYQHYFLPIAFVTDDAYADDNRIMDVTINGQAGSIIDAIYLEAFRKLVFTRIVEAEPHDTTRVQYHRGDSLKEDEYKSSRVMGAEQSNTSIIINDSSIIKFFRRIYQRKNPDYELSRFLSDKKGFKNTPAYQGSLNIIDSERLMVTIALMQELIPNDGDAWEFMLNELDGIFSNLDARNIDIDALPEIPFLKRITLEEVPSEITDWVGTDIFKRLQKLALRTAEMHIALGSEFEETAFEPQHFNGDYEVWFKNRMLYQFQNRLNTVENNLHKLEGLARDLALQFLDQKN